MLFKTRIGLYVIDGTFDIVPSKPKNSPSWWIYAHLRQGGEIEGRTLFKTFSLRGPWIHLVGFDDHPGIEVEIGDAMQIIAEAMAGSAPLCDLSKLGSVAAWGKDVTHVQWP